MSALLRFPSDSSSAKTATPRDSRHRFGPLLRPAGAAALHRFLMIWAVLVAVPSLWGTAQAQPPGGRPDRPAEAARFHEANRLLEEEIKLAAHPRIYLLLDLSVPALLVKGRGLVLYRIPVTAWSVAGKTVPRGLYRLRDRPPVDRPQAQPGTDPTANPIDLSDMPGEYELFWDPPLRIAVSPPAKEQPWLWTRSYIRHWWRRIIGLRGRAEEPAAAAGRAQLRLVLPLEAARSLAWTVTEGIPLLVGWSAPAEVVQEGRANGPGVPKHPH